MPVPVSSHTVCKFLRMTNYLLDIQKWLLPDPDMVDERCSVSLCVSCI